MKEVRTLPELKMRPDELLLSLAEDLEGVCALMSNGKEGSRWSVICAQPTATTDSLEGIDKDWKSQSSDSELPFLGGWIGSLDYERGYEYLELPTKKRSDASFARYEEALIYDHQEQIWYCLGVPDWIPEKSKELNVQETDLQALWTREQYMKAFEELHENIRIGEIYQACLTFPFEGAAVDKPRDFFVQQLRSQQPEMAFFMDQGSRQIMSLSPERFLSWQDGQLHTMPIKGTRKRGKNAEEDQRLQEELLADEKEKAELSMITDLLRNDLASVSLPGTVKVEGFQALLELSHVWHSYSSIRSQSKPDLKPSELLRRVFPGGSISGCPKRRAVEILRDLEDFPRGIYTGCLGYFSDHGRMDLNIAIRTLVQENDRIRAGFGGGIVYDSQAEREYQECYAKSSPFLS